MARLKLSSDAVERFQPIALLSTEATRGLVEELESGLTTKLALDDDLERLLNASPVLSRFTEEQRAALGEAIVGLHLLRYSSSKDIASVVADVVEAHAAAKKGDWGQLRENLTLLLQIKVIQGSIKAWTLIDDNDKTFLTSRIITDVRPVFDDSIKKPLLASLIIHTIRLTFRQNGRQEEIFLSVDADDLREIQTCIQRALEKEESLTRLIRSYPEKEFGSSLLGVSDV